MYWIQDHYGFYAEMRRDGYRGTKLFSVFPVCAVTTTLRRCITILYKLKDLAGKSEGLCTRVSASTDSSLMVTTRDGRMWIKPTSERLLREIIGEVLVPYHYLYYIKQLLFNEKTLTTE